MMSRLRLIRCSGGTLILIYGVYLFIVSSCVSKTPNNASTVFNYSPQKLYPFVDKKWVKKSTVTNGYTFVQTNEQEFGLTFSVPLEYFDLKPVNKVLLKTRIFAKQPLTEVFWVLEIKNQDRQLLYDALNLNDSVKTLNRWTSISKTIELKTPKLYNPLNEMKLYFWNKSRSEWEYDAIEVELFE